MGTPSKTINESVRSTAAEASGESPKTWWETAMLGKGLRIPKPVQRSERYDARHMPTGDGKRSSTVPPEIDKKIPDTPKEPPEPPKLKSGNAAIINHALKVLSENPGLLDDTQRQLFKAFGELHTNIAIKQKLAVPMNLVERTFTYLCQILGLDQRSTTTRRPYLCEISRKYFSRPKETPAPTGPADGVTE